MGLVSGSGLYWELTKAYIISHALVGHLLRQHEALQGGGGVDKQQVFLGNNTAILEPIRLEIR